VLIKIADGDEEAVSSPAAAAWVLLVAVELRLESVEAAV
jgi:hypothetical protein